MTDERAGVWEFVCDNLVPGCTHRDQDEKQEALLKRAEDHYRAHHSWDHSDGPLEETLKETGIQFIRPA